MPEPAPLFDVFLSYNSRDRAAVLPLAEALKLRGLRVWLDDWEVAPGSLAQEVLEAGLRDSGAAAVLVGPSGIGPWENQEMWACIALAVKRRMRVIPVILPGVPEAPDLPLLLANFSWLRLGAILDEESLSRLEWGIRGGKPLKPEPGARFPNERVRDLAQQLEDAKSRLEEATVSGENQSAIRIEILALRRQMREGGRLRAGDSLQGRFRLLEEIGRGGFAAVWKAYDRKRQELVAVKILHHAQSDDRTRRERFFRGAKKMAELRHPGIVRVIEAELEDDGHYFFVMEFVEGGDFRRAVLSGQLPPEKVLPVIISVGEALTYAHGKGLVHRDVKPANILLGADGPKLTDFDLVRAFDSTGGTHTQSMLGTFLFTAPEILQDAKAASVLADVYSLAMTAVFGLYGKDLPLDVLRYPEKVLAELSVSEGMQASLGAGISWSPDERPSTVNRFCHGLAGPEPTLTPANGTVWIHSKSGEAWIERSTGIRFLWIPGGRFQMGRTKHNDEKPVHWVRISPFMLGETPVTNGQYGVFLKKMGHREPEYWQDHRFSEPEQPVVGVSWVDALKFCAWLSKEAGRTVSLPSQAQWEFAARGTNGREYPWGNEPPDETRACYGLALEKGQPAPVGSFPKGRGPFGTLDQAGNVWEWCLDQWDEQAYSKRAAGEELIDPVVPSEPANVNLARVLRGGCWDDPADVLGATVSFGSPAWVRLAYVGFRVAALARL